jgi:hypothetical protein
MADFDIGFKIASHTSAREMCRLRGIRCDEWEPIGDTLQTTERLADRAFRASSGGNSFVVYFEAFTQWKQDARWNLLAKSALLSERERLPTRTFVFVLTRDGYQEQNGTFQLAIENETTQQVWFREICLWREQPQPWWASVPGLMTLYPLTAHHQSANDAVVYAAHAINDRVGDTVVRSNLLATLSIFANLAYPDVDAKELIGVELMRESKFLAQIEAEGELKSARVALEDVLAVRFGTAAGAEFVDTLNAIKDLDKLRELHKLAIKCRGLGPFRKALPKKT